MSETTCPNCGKTVPDWKHCARCGHPLTEEARAEQTAAREAEDEDAAPPEVAGAQQSGAETPPSVPPASEFAPSSEEGPPPPPPPEGAERPGVTPESVQPRGPHQEPVVAGATPIQQAAEDARSPGPAVDGQARCPNCGEAVYAGERVCWSCSRRLDTAEPTAERQPQPAPGGGPPASGAPVSRRAPSEPAAAPRADGPAPQRPPSAAETPQKGPAREPSSEAVSYAWWSFGLGLLSVFTCGVLGLLGIASLWLGISSARRDGGAVAIAGAVFGAIGLLMLLAWIIALAIVMPGMMRPGPTHIILPTFF